MITACRESLKQARAAERKCDDFIIDIFKKPYKNLSGEECLKIFNMYGLDVKAIYLLAASHGFTISSDEFIFLIRDQESLIKEAKPC